MSRRRPQVRDTRERVLAAALQEFSSRGYQASSIEDIAAKAGVTKGAVYYYFRDKEDLASDLQEDLWKRLADEAAGAFQAEGPMLGRLKRGFRAYLGALQDLGEARFFLRDCWAVPALDVAGRSTVETGASLLVGILDEGVASGEIATIDTKAAATVLVGAFAEATLHILTTGETDATVDVVDRLIDALAAQAAPAALAAPAAQAAPAPPSPARPAARPEQPTGPRPATRQGRGRR